MADSPHPRQKMLASGAWAGLVSMQYSKKDNIPSLLCFFHFHINSLSKPNLTSTFISPTHSRVGFQHGDKYKHACPGHRRTRALTSRQAKSQA
jgi:hypothetical protein